MKIYSERFAIKYLVSDSGVCFGIDTKKCSYLFIASRMGVLFKRRPVGDKVVENLNYEIPAIHRALLEEKKRSDG